MFMPRKKTAMANAAICPSPIAPDVRPAMNSPISSPVNARPSRLARMISCGSIRILPWTGPDISGNELGQLASICLPSVKLSGIVLDTG